MRLRKCHERHIVSSALAVHGTLREEMRAADPLFVDSALGEHEMLPIFRQPYRSAPASFLLHY